jgi:hypothetical protein
MIFRLSQKLNAKIKAGTLGVLPMHENPFADWSAQAFAAGRTQYIILTNTKSLYSTVMPAKGVTNSNAFIEQALSSIREFMEADEEELIYDRFIMPATEAVQFSKALNRSVTGSMNDMIRHAAYWLAVCDILPLDVGFQLYEIPMSALKSSGSSCGFPRDVFKAMASGGKS